MTLKHTDSDLSAARAKGREETAASIRTAIRELGPDYSDIGRHEIDEAIDEAVRALSPSSPGEPAGLQEDTMKLDAKIYGEVRKVKDDTLVPEDEYVVFLAKDNAFALTLPFYRATCVQLGADREQIAAVDRMMDRLSAWRAAHPDRLKTPDAQGEKLLG